MANPPFVLAVGSPMWDSQVCVHDKFLETHGLLKGDAKQMDDKYALDLLKDDARSQSPYPMVHGCGGCACNTGKVLACLRYAVGMCGGIGQDAVAEHFRAGLQKLGMQDLTVPASKAAEDTVSPDAETGEVLCLVTPDNERTFAFRSGASATLKTSALCATLQQQDQVKMVYFDVYTMLCPGFLTEDGMKEAKKIGAKVCLNLGSAGIVQAMRYRIWELMSRGLVDAIMMNESEAHAICTEYSENQSAVALDPHRQVLPGELAERACRECAKFCELTVVTLGAFGLWIASGKGADPVFHGVTPIPAEEVYDSTGAGDFFAGGFLAAWLRGLNIRTCCDWGSLAAAEVLRRFGTDIGDEGRAKLNRLCD